MHNSAPSALVWPPYGLSKPFALSLAAAAVSGLVLLPASLSGAVVAASLFVAVILALLVAYDVTEMRLPDALTWPLTAAGLLFHAVHSPDAIGSCVAGAAAGYAVLAVADLGYRQVRGVAGMGRGDAKLFAAAGAWIGLAGLPSVLLAAAVAALVAVGIAAASGRPIEAGARIPFGPFLALGLWLVWVAGPLA